MTTSYLTRAHWERQVIDMARLWGWKLLHFRESTTQHGRVSPVQGGAGFPALMLVRDRVLFVELHVGNMPMRKEQEAWRAALVEAGADYRVWRPDDFEEIRQTLRSPDARRRSERGRPARRVDRLEPGHPDDAVAELP